MVSPLVLINGTPQINGVNVPYGSEVTVSLASSVGVSSWDVTCIGTDELNSITSINAGLTINQASQTATFMAPDGYGSAMIFSSIVNNGIDINGVLQPSYKTTFGTYVLTTDGYRVGAQNETIEGSAAYGWLTKLNPLIRKA